MTLEEISSALGSSLFGVKLVDISQDIAAYTQRLTFRCLVCGKHFYVAFYQETLVSWEPTAVFDMVRMRSRCPDSACNQYLDSQLAMRSTMPNYTRQYMGQPVYPANNGLPRPSRETETFAQKLKRIGLAREEPVKQEPAAEVESKKPEPVPWQDCSDKHMFAHIMDELALDEKKENKQ